jgi:proteasome accessory factor A
VDRRIFWLETEYGVTGGFGPPAAARPPEEAWPPEEAARFLLQPVIPRDQNGPAVLRNTARLYLDAGRHPVYATPECDSLHDLIAYDKAGEQILEGLLVDAGRRRPSEDIDLFKNNADAAGNSFGCHEHYLVGRRGEFGRLADILIPFLVTRQLLCGPGKILPTRNGAAYCLSQRSEHIWAAVSTVTRSKPIISTRDEPHVRADGFRRLHVTVGDPNMSETTMLLKIGSTDLVLRMIDAGTRIRDLTLDNPIRALREVSRDLTGRSRIRLAHGPELTALEIQREYLTRVQDFTGRNGADPVSQRVLELWERTLDAITTGNLDAIAREIDWVIKYQLIERYRARHDLPLSAPRLAQLDLGYHDVRRGRGQYYQLERSGAVERVVRDIDIFEAKTVPPILGRAA